MGYTLHLNSASVCAVGLYWWAFGQDSDARWGGASSGDGPMAPFRVEEPQCEWSDRYHDRLGALASTHFLTSLLFSPSSFSLSSSLSLSLLPSSLSHSLLPFLPLTLPPPFLPQAHEPEGQEDVPLHVINNYFSVGADAQVALDFHLERGTN